jgi:hypothetical protein
MLSASKRSTVDLDRNAPLSPHLSVTDQASVEEQGAEGRDDAEKAVAGTLEVHSGSDSESSPQVSNEDHPSQRSKRRQRKNGVASNGEVFSWNVISPSSAAANSHSSAAVSSTVEPIPAHLSNAAKSLLAMFPSLSPALFAPDAVAAASALSSSGLPSLESILFVQLRTLITQAHAQRLIVPVSDAMYSMMNAEQRCGKLREVQADILRGLMRRYLQEEMDDMAAEEERRRKGEQIKPDNHALVPLAAHLTQMVDAAAKQVATGAAAAQLPSTSDASTSISPQAPVHVDSIEAAAIAATATTPAAPSVAVPVSSPVASDAASTGALPSSSGSATTISPSQPSASFTWSRLRSLMPEKMAQLTEQALSIATGHEEDQDEEQDTVAVPAEDSSATEEMSNHIASNHVSDFNVVPQRSSSAQVSIAGVASAVPSSDAFHPLSTAAALHLPPAAAAPAVSVTLLPPIPASLSTDTLVSLNLSFLSESHQQRAQLTQRLCLQLQEQQQQAFVKHATEVTAAGTTTSGWQSQSNWPLNGGSPASSMNGISPPSISAAMVYSEMYQILQGMHATLAERLQQRMQQKTIEGPSPEVSALRLHSAVHVPVATPPAASPSVAASHPSDGPAHAVRDNSESRWRSRHGRRRSSSTDDATAVRRSEDEDTVSPPAPLTLNVTMSDPVPSTSHSNGVGSTHSNEAPEIGSRPPLLRPSSFPFPPRADVTPPSDSDSSLRHHGPTTPMRHATATTRSHVSGDDMSAWSHAADGPSHSDAHLRTPPPSLFSVASQLLTPSPGSVAAAQLQQQMEQKQQPHGSPGYPTGLGRMGSTYASSRSPVPAVSFASHQSRESPALHQTRRARSPTHRLPWNGALASGQGAHPTHGSGTSPASMPATSPVLQSSNSATLVPPSSSQALKHHPQTSQVHAPHKASHSTLQPDRLPVFLQQQQQPSHGQFSANRRRAGALMSTLSNNSHVGAGSSTTGRVSGEAVTSSSSRRQTMDGTDRDALMMMMNSLGRETGTSGRRDRAQTEGM